MKKIVLSLLFLAGVAVFANSTANDSSVNTNSQDVTVSAVSDTLYGVYDMYAYPETANNCLKSVKVYEENNACGSYYALLDGEHYRVKQGRGGTGDRFTHYINYGGKTYRFCL